MQARVQHLTSWSCPLVSLSIGASGKQLPGKCIHTHRQPDIATTSQQDLPCTAAIGQSWLARVQASWPTAHHVGMHDGGAKDGLPLNVYPHVVTLQAVVNDLDGHNGTLPASLQHAARLSGGAEA